MDKLSKPVPFERQKDLIYVFLDTKPRIPPQSTPTQSECIGYEYITMVQFCNVAEKFGLSRSKACNAFGGDKGKYKVKSTRMARAIMIGNQLRKYVLTSAVFEYFMEQDIQW